MKFATTFLLLTSLVVALPSEEKKDTTTTPAPCVNVLACKLADQKKETEPAKAIKECDAKKDAEKTKCTYEALGFKGDDIEKVSKLDAAYTKCAPKTDDKYTECTGKCTDDKKDECIAKCDAPLIESFGKCMGEIAGEKDFDIKKTSDCSKKCTEKTSPEVYACEYKCNKELYDKVIAAKPTESKDGKDKSGNSSAMSNFGMSSFGAMAVGTVLSALLI
jgi:hypothetical protein